MPTDTMTTCTTVARAERPRYFPRQVITADDLTLDQEYFLKKQRMHNLLLHGWGVVCGARVECSTKPWTVLIRPGFILGPCGDEILIERDICFDLRTRCTTSAQPDPCGGALPAPPAQSTVFVAIKYKQVRSRPIRTLPAGCGCDDNQCEFSRWCDGYEICVLDACPHPAGDPPPIADLFTGRVPDCPPPAANPWVNLAVVTMTSDGVVNTIDMHTCRRQVASYARFWWVPNEPVITCTPVTPPPTDNR